jgi:outer membrane murein-binding lipoprotein Lpp
MPTHKFSTAIRTAKTAYLLSVVVVLAPILLVTGCSKHDQALAELTTKLAQLQEHQERLKAELDKVSESHASLETELATVNEELDFEALKDWRLNGRLEASTLTLSHAQGAPYKTLIGGGKIFFFEGDLIRGSVSGTELMLSGDSVASIKLSASSSTNVFEIGISDLGVKVASKSENYGTLSTVTPSGAYISLTSEGTFKATLGATGESVGLEMEQAGSSIALRADNERAQSALTHADSVIELYADGKAALSRFHVKGFDKYSAALGIIHDNDVPRAVMKLKNSDSNSESLFESNQLLFNKGDQPVVELGNSPIRGGWLRIFDEIAAPPRIMLALDKDTGSPFIIAAFGDKLNALTHERN